MRCTKPLLQDSTSSPTPWFPFRTLGLGSEGFHERSSQLSERIKSGEACKTVHLAWRPTLTTSSHTYTHTQIPRPLLQQRKRLHQNSPHLLAQSASRPSWDWTRFITPLWCISSFNFTALHLFPRQDQLWAQIKTNLSHISCGWGDKKGALASSLGFLLRRTVNIVKMRGRHVKAILSKSLGKFVFLKAPNTVLLSIPL